MKKMLILSFAVVLSVGGLRAQNEPIVKDSLAYALGVQIGDYFKGSGFTKISLSEFQSALAMVLANQPTVMTPQQAQQFINKKNQETRAAQGAVAKKAGEDFLAANKKRPGVTTTASGLQYEILKAGNGPKPTAKDKVKVHYHGTLTDGTVFDSSVERGQPIDFPVTGVIQGWIEALQLMPEGSKWKVFIPYNLAYGERGQGAKIGPFAALVFEIELLQVIKQ
jgi:FKBP-type peptidyl-prolyl cis-trans isomerase FklB